MSCRRGAPSCQPGAVERREWYDGMQKELYFQESSDEDSDNGLSKADGKESRISTIETQKTSKTKISTADSRNTGESRRLNSNSQSKTTEEEGAPFVNFAANLAWESKERQSKIAADLVSSETVLTTSKAIKEYEVSILDRSLLRLNSPRDTRLDLNYI